MHADPLPSMSPEEAFVQTVSFAGRQADGALEHAEALFWMVTAAVLASQQSAVLALRGAGDAIPAHAGATELLLRAASRDRLPAPFTLPFSAQAQRDFEGLVDARNRAMHPRGEVWHVSPRTLARGLPVAVRSIRHLVLVQPVIPDLVPPAQRHLVEDSLDALMALANHLGLDKEPR